MTFSFYRQTPIAVLIVEAGQSLVRVGGFKELSEAVYDKTLDSIAFSKSDVVSVYDIALSGGEPYALWS